MFYQFEFGLIIGGAILADLKVLLVSDDVDNAGTLKSGLSQSGANYVDVMSVSEDLLSKLSSDDYGLLVLECKFPTERFFEAFADICGAIEIPIICFSNERDSRVIAKSVEAGVVSYIVDDKSISRIQPIVDVALARFNERKSLKKELAQLKDKLAKRALIEKAKGLLIEAKKMTEDDAYHYMRKKAMNQGRRLTDVAQEVCDGLASSSMAASDYAAGGHFMVSGDDGMRPVAMGQD